MRIVKKKCIYCAGYDSTLCIYWQFAVGVEPRIKLLFGRYGTQSCRDFESVLLVHRSFNELRSNAALAPPTVWAHGADGGTRTPTGLLPTDFKSVASTGSATSAYVRQLLAGFSETTNRETRSLSPGQHSTTLTARPPSLVSLYLRDMSSPVWRMVSIT